jgi:hypothetical protein
MNGTSYDRTTPEGRRALAASGGKGSHRPQSLAKRLVKAYPDLSPEDQDDVITELRKIATNRERGPSSA